MELNAGINSRNIYDRIASLLKRDVPLRDCNFVLSDPEGNEILLKALDIPDSGIDFSFSDTIGYLPIPSVKMSAIGVEGYILKSKIDTESDFLSSLYYSQFEEGLLKITSGVQLTVSARVYKEKEDAGLFSIIDNILTSSDETQIQNVLVFNGCYCSVPKYSASYSSNKFVSVRSTVYYRDFTSVLEF